MPGKRIALLAAIMGLSSLPGCAVTDLPHCVSRAAMLNSDTQSLNVILGIPTQLAAESPYVTISRSLDGASTNPLELKLLPSPSPWPTELDETRCTGLDWRTYRVEVGRDDWEQFWATAEPPGIRLRIGFSGTATKVLPASRFAFALVTGETSAPLISLGCYWI